MKFKNYPFKVGGYVQCHYNAPWYAEVLEIIERSGYEPLLRVKTICTHDGRAYRKPYIKTYSAYWFTPEATLPERYLNEQISCSFI